MGLFTQDDLYQARQMDLLTYLKNYEPGELVKISNGNYCTREHDSLKISNGKWYWFSRQIGGSSALDYLIHVKGYTLPAAVETILGRAASKPPVTYKQEAKKPKQLVLPDKSPTTYHVTRYLRTRGIHPAVTGYCILNNLLYEGLPYRNAVFVGYDDQGAPRFAALRATKGQFKGDAAGSDKQYSFRIIADGESDTVHVFESAIDLLSYASLEHMAGRSWRREHLLSLSGVAKSTGREVIPYALKHFLQANPQVDTLWLHLDNDAAGREATESIVAGLSDRYVVIDDPPKYGKDMNDELKHVFPPVRHKENFER